MDTHAQIEWVKQQILHQIDAGMMQFCIAESGAQAVLQWAHQNVQLCIGKIDVQHAMCMHVHLQDTGALQHIKSKDRLQCLYDYFYNWVELELATRYA